jgi:hypothetical protein
MQYKKTILFSNYRGNDNMACKKSNKGSKSTVISMRDDYDWGKILYNACYVFNRNLAEYWKSYALSYNERRKEVLKSEQEINKILDKRNSIIHEKSKLKEDVRYFSSQATYFYRQYVKQLPVGMCVAEWRNNKSAQDYQDIINLRKQYYLNYVQNFDLKTIALNIEDEYKNKHLFETRELGNQARSLTKLANLYKLELEHPISEDIDILYDFISSEDQIEKLMGVCISILETYSEKEFSTLMYIKDRENIANSIFNYFNEFQHNYDFLAGCYEIKNDKLVLKDLEVLKNKFYNGYYLTILGFMRNAYSETRDEHFNIQSSDQFWQDDEGNGNHGIDLFTNTEKHEGGYSISAASNENFSEGMYDFWLMCKSFLIDNIDEMANELHHQMVSNFPEMNFYKNMKNNYCMIKLLTNTLDRINEELYKGNNVGFKLKHIVLDSMGGAETKDEWNKCSISVLAIIKKYMQRFFQKNQAELLKNI